MRRRRRERRKDKTKTTKIAARKRTYILRFLVFASMGRGKVRLAVTGWS